MIAEVIPGFVEDPYTEKKMAVGEKYASKSDLVVSVSE